FRPAPVDYPAPHSFPTRRSSDLRRTAPPPGRGPEPLRLLVGDQTAGERRLLAARGVAVDHTLGDRLVERADGLENSGASVATRLDRKSTRLNSSHVSISYAVFCL